MGTTTVGAVPQVPTGERSAAGIGAIDDAELATVVEGAADVVVEGAGGPAGFEEPEVVVEELPFDELHAPVINAIPTSAGIRILRAENNSVSPF